MLDPRNTRATRFAGEPPPTGMRNRCGTPRSFAFAEVMDWPSGAHAGDPSRSSASVTTRVPVPSACTVDKVVCPSCRAEKAIDLPSARNGWTSDNLRTMAVPQLCGSLVPDFPDALAGFRQQRCKADSPDQIVERTPFQWSTGRETWDDIWTGESARRNRQSVLFGVTSVTTRRRPSALAAKDEYRSSPEVRR